MQTFYSHFRKHILTRKTNTQKHKHHKARVTSGWSSLMPIIKVVVRLLFITSRPLRPTDGPNKRQTQSDNYHQLGSSGSESVGRGTVSIRNTKATTIGHESNRKKRKQIHKKKQKLYNNNTRKPRAADCEAIGKKTSMCVRKTIWEENERRKVFVKRGDSAEWTRARECYAPVSRISCGRIVGGVRRRFLQPFALRWLWKYVFHNYNERMDWDKHKRSNRMYHTPPLHVFYGENVCSITIRKSANVSLSLLSSLSLWLKFLCSKYRSPHIVLTDYQMIQHSLTHTTRDGRNVGNAWEECEHISCQRAKRWRHNVLSECCLMACAVSMVTMEGRKHTEDGTNNLHHYYSIFQRLSATRYDVNALPYGSVAAVE